MDRADEVRREDEGRRAKHEGRERGGRERERRDAWRWSGHNRKMVLAWKRGKAAERVACRRGRGNIAAGLVPEESSVRLRDFDFTSSTELFIHSFARF